jgi:Ni/Fe-hydrogenase subunit HybB-like protein
VVILGTELGKPWAAPVIFLSWQPTSALFEVALCATAYTMVLFLEFGSIAAKHYGWQRALRPIGIVYLPAVVLGVTLSHLHQSSVGTLLTIVPLKVDPRWWSELLPAQFLVTAYLAGISLVTIEHVIATHYLRLKPRVDLMGGLARIQIGLLVLFLLLRIPDLLYRGAVEEALQFTGLSYLLWTELIFGFIVPLALFAIPEARESKWLLFLGSCLVAFGALFMRLNTAVFGMRVNHWETYFPSVGEFASSLGVLAGGILVYGWLVRNLPIHSEEPLEEEPSTSALPHGAEAIG